MPVFQVIDSGGSLSDELVPITDLHFGGNLLINYTDFTNPISDFNESIAELGLTTIRYPGGAVTEQFFDLTNPDASSVEYKGAVVDLVPFSDFIGYAAASDVSVTIVIPTRDGFTTTAEEALLDGTYGNRNIDARFVENAASFSVDAIQSAIAAGVVVDSFEIGNEFWGSGKMTAAEYGHLAAEMSIAIEAQLIAAGIPAHEQPDIIVQGIVSSGKYSPTPWSTGGLFIYEMEDGSLWSSPIEYTAGQTPPDFENIAISLVLGEYEVPNQGIINFQNHQIIEALIEAGAIDALDGIVLHYYGDVDISEIDVLDQRVFEVLELYSLLDGLRSPHLPPLTQFITEWNIRGGETHPRNGNGGLLQAQYLIEMFYEMVTNGIDAAHVWPIRNTGTQLSSLIDVDGEGLSIAGEVFSVMSELLIGLTPSLDYEFSHISGSGHIDIHGFEDNTREVFFVSERSGLNDIFTLDLTDAVDGGQFFFSVMILGAQGNPTNPNAEPIWAQNGISVINGIPIIDLLLSPYSIAVIEVTYITYLSDTINGSLGNDRISGLGGDDELFGHEGDDTLYGGYGSDELNGGSGDDVLYGDADNDTLIGGEGSDALFGRAGDDLLVIDQDDLRADGGPGEDTLSLADLDSGASIWTLDQIIELDNWLVGFDNIECIEGSSSSDRFSISTSNIDIFGMSGNDWFEIFASGNFLVSGGDGSDVFNIFSEADGQYFGDGGNDSFNIFSGSGTYRGGAGDDTFNSFNSNADTFVFSANHGDDTIVGFNVGIDRIALELNVGDTYQILELSSGTMIDFDQGGSVFLAEAYGEIEIYFLF